MSKNSLFIAAFVAGLGGLLFGFDNIVISGAIPYIGQLFRLNAAGIGWAAGCALVGCIGGSMGAGAFVDRFGQKKGLALCALCFALSSAGIWFAEGLRQFALWRIIGGVGIGAASIVAPMYIAEIAPTRLRGRLVTLYQLGIVVGILAAVFVNMEIQRMGDDAWNTTTGWRWMFVMGLFPATLFGGMILFAPESPRWLMKMGRRSEAMQVLTKIEGPEAEALASVIHKLSQAATQSIGSLSAICPRHFRMLAAHLENTEVIKQLLPLRGWAKLSTSLSNHMLLLNSETGHTVDHPR